MIDPDPEDHNDEVKSPTIPPTDWSKSKITHYSLFDPVTGKCIEGSDAETGEKLSNNPLHIHIRAPMSKT